MGRQENVDWTPLSVTRTAHAVPRRELVLAADRAGVVIVSAPRLARVAGVSTRTAWSWLRAQRVSAESDRALRTALGLPVRRAA